MFYILPAVASRCYRCSHHRAAVCVLWCLFCLEYGCFEAGCGRFPFIVSVLPTIDPIEISLCEHYLQYFLKKNWTNGAAVGLWVSLRCGWVRYWWRWCWQWKQLIPGSGSCQTPISPFDASLCFDGSWMASRSLKAPCKLSPLCARTRLGLAPCKHWFMECLHASGGTW